MDWVILAEEAAWPSPDCQVVQFRDLEILAEEAAWPSPDLMAMVQICERILAEEAAWPSPDENCCESPARPPPAARIQKVGLDFRTGCTGNGIAK